MMEEAMLSEHVISSEQLYKGKILNVQKWMVTLPNGAQALREVVLHPGASAVVPVDDEGNTYLVRQYRAPLGEILTEIPAGKLDGKEDHMICAVRELSEETGFTADTFVDLGCFFTSPGYSDEIIHVYLATGLHAGKSHLDEGEFLNVEKIPFETLLELAMDGSIIDAKTVIALTKAKLYFDAKERKA